VKPGLEWRFLAMYMLLAAGLASMLTLLVVTARSQTVRAAPVKLEPIRNDTWPNKIEIHFAGKPLHTFPANLIPGMPEDGYCKDYSNQISWRVFVCMGTQPETQP